MKEAYLYDKSDEQSVVCNLGAHHCLIRPGWMDICGVREDRAGVWTAPSPVFTNTRRRKTSAEEVQI
ncbi:MAG: hypothetical protein AB7G75_03325 [Candidatus Binatia bacterium]